MNLNQISRKLHEDGHDDEEIELIVDRLAEDAYDDARDRELEQNWSE